MPRASRASAGQLELPGLAAAADEPLAVPEPRRAVACARCGWFREWAAACPVCQHAPAPTPPDA